MALTKIVRQGIADDAIDGTKIADDVINSEHIVDAGVDSAHINDVAASKLTGTIASGRLSATNLGSGTVPTARLGSGTADNTKFLRGDNTWQVVDTSSKLNLSGGTMTGNLIVSGASTPKLTVKSNDGTSASVKLQRINEDDSSTDFELKNDGGAFKVIADNNTNNERTVLTIGADGDVIFGRPTGTNYGDFTFSEFSEDNQVMFPADRLGIGKVNGGTISPTTSPRSAQIISWSGNDGNGDIQLLTNQAQAENSYAGIFFVTATRAGEGYSAAFWYKGNYAQHGIVNIWSNSRTGETAVVTNTGSNNGAGHKLVLAGFGNPADWSVTLYLTHGRQNIWFGDE